MTMLNRRSVLAGLIGAVAAPAAALARGWRLLGSRRVRLSGDYDIIPVSASKGTFRAIRLRVRENAVFVNSVTVVYGNGSRDDLPVRYLIPAGGETRPLDLRGRERVIRSVQLSYRSARNGRGQARVEVWGLDY